MARKAFVGILQGGWWFDQLLARSDRECSDWARLLEQGGRFRYVGSDFKVNLRDKN